MITFESGYKLGAYGVHLEAGEGYGSYLNRMAMLERVLMFDKFEMGRVDFGIIGGDFNFRVQPIREDMEQDCVRKLVVPPPEVVPDKTVVNSSSEDRVGSDHKPKPKKGFQKKRSCSTQSCELRRASTRKLSPSRGDESGMDEDEEQEGAGNSEDISSDVTTDLSLSLGTSASEVLALDVSPFGACQRRGGNPNDGPVPGLKLTSFTKLLRKCSLRNLYGRGRGSAERGNCHVRASSVHGTSLRSNFPFKNNSNRSESSAYRNNICSQYTNGGYNAALMHQCNYAVSGYNALFGPFGEAVPSGMRRQYHLSGMSTNNVLLSQPPLLNVPNLFRNMLRSYLEEQYSREILGFRHEMAFGQESSRQKNLLRTSSKSSFRKNPHHDNLLLDFFVQMLFYQRDLNQNSALIAETFGNLCAYSSLRESQKSRKVESVVNYRDLPPKNPVLSTCDHELPRAPLCVSSADCVLTGPPPPKAFFYNWVIYEIRKRKLAQRFFSAQGLERVEEGVFENSGSNTCFRESKVSEKVSKEEILSSKRSSSKPSQKLKHKMICFSDLSGTHYVDNFIPNPPKMNDETEIMDNLRRDEWLVTLSSLLGLLKEELKISSSSSENKDPHIPIDLYDSHSHLLPLLLLRLREAPISFLPSYKLDLSNDSLAGPFGPQFYTTKRIPSWCDRVLFFGSASTRVIAGEDYSGCYVNVGNGCSRMGEETDGPLGDAGETAEKDSERSAQDSEHKETSAAVTDNAEDTEPAQLASYFLPCTYFSIDQSSHFWSDHRPVVLTGVLNAPIFKANGSSWAKIVSSGRGAVSSSRSFAPFSLEQFSEGTPDTTDTTGEMSPQADQDSRDNDVELSSAATSVESLIFAHSKQQKQHKQHEQREVSQKESQVLQKQFQEQQGTSLNCFKGRKQGGFSSSSSSMGKIRVSNSEGVSNSDPQPVISSPMVTILRKN